MMTNHFTLFSHNMFLILPTIVAIFCSCEDNDSVPNKSCCVDDSIDEQKISDDAIFKQEYQPVCGCNGINDCYAEDAGVTVWIGGDGGQI